MSGLIGVLLMFIAVYFYQVLLVWPVNLVSWLHFPSWLLLGIGGGLLAWCLVDD